MQLVAVAAESGEILPGAGGFVLIGLGAFTLPLIARRLGLPAIVLEIVYGLLLGPEVLDLIERTSADAAFIEVLAELGLLLLMFLAGFEVDFERLERQGRGPIVFGLTIFVLIVGFAWVGFGFLDLETIEERIFVTLLTSAASVGLIIPALRTTNRATTRLGQYTLVTAVLAEFLSALGIVVFGVVHESGFGVRLLSVPALFVIMGVLLVTVRRAAWWYPERFERLFAAHDPDELGIRASLALLFVFVGLSLALDIEAILGAFLAGALFAFVFRDTGELEARLGAFAFGFFIPVFFINVGLRFPLSNLSDREVLGTAVALIVVAIVAKVLPALLLVARGLTLRESAAAGVLLAGQLSVIIALAEFGVELGVIDEGLEAGAILLVGVTAILSPIVFKLLAPALASESATFQDVRDLDA
ncbi:MAG TPA: cation:proton antiporter [Acidimicrobiia bacterium]|jgi:Kef-type K+ transport system membrane component KefB